jgi:AAA+ ATPase superfamily predicted ATPase
MKEERRMKKRLPGFVGRESELALLGHWLREIRRTGAGKAIAVRGRRAVGKSTLIEEMLVGERVAHAFYAAVKDQPSTEALAGFLNELTRSTLPVAQELQAGVRPDSWEAALRLIATSCQSACQEAQREGEIIGPMCLVIDELPWLSEQEPSIEGLLQNAWDRHLERLPLLLVLIGSDLHMMESLDRYDRPLYGRVTPLRIEPLHPAEVREMTRTDPAGALDAYCMLGGLPQLAVTWRAADTPRTYLERELSAPTSPIVVTGERVMHAELPPQATPAAVVAAIGTGESEFTKILARSGVGRTSLTAALHMLAGKRIVERQTPFAGGRTAKLSRYTIADPYLRFYLRFIAPNLPLIERRRGDLATARIMDSWSTFRGHAIEPIVRASVERMLPDERFGQARYVNSYWTRTNDPEVDLVGHDDPHHPTTAAFVGSVKWRSSAPFAREDSATLAAVRPRVPLTTETTLLVGVSRSGFSPRAALDVRLGPEDLLDAWLGPAPSR